LKQRNHSEQKPGRKNRKAKDEGDGKMMVPVRCFSCGKVIGHLYEQFRKMVEQGEKAETALDELKIKRYCCRRMIFSQADLIDDIMRFKV